MKTINVSQAGGPVLDWLVAKANNDLHPVGNVRVLDEKVFSIEAGDYERSDRWQQYNPSTDWSQGGPIIERENIALYPHGDGTYEAEVFLNPKRGAGPTPLIAAMRCFVTSKLGESVAVPEELS